MKFGTGNSSVVVNEKRLQQGMSSHERLAADTHQGSVSLFEIEKGEGGAQSNGADLSSNSFSSGTELTTHVTLHFERADLSANDDCGDDPDLWLTSAGAAPVVAECEQPPLEDFNDEAMSSGHEVLPPLNRYDSNLLTKRAIDDTNREAVWWESSFPAFSDTRTATSQLPPAETSRVWHDICDAALMGRRPERADVYRQKLISAVSSGLAEHMGCHDGVMYLLSEAVCLRYAISAGIMDDTTIRDYVEFLIHHLAVLESAYPHSREAGQPCAAQHLPTDVTAIFCTAIRIYLCALVPGHDQRHPAIVRLVDTMADLLRALPAIPGNIDDGLVWPLTVGRDYSLPDSAFRLTLKRRIDVWRSVAPYGHMTYPLYTVLDPCRHGD